MFIVFPSVIRVYILSSKNFLVIFSKSAIFVICLWILATSARLYCYYIFGVLLKKQYHQFYRWPFVIKDTCLNNDDIGSCQVGWTINILATKFVHSKSVQSRCYSVMTSRIGRGWVSAFLFCDGKQEEWVVLDERS